MTSSTTTDYIGNKLYENGNLTRMMMDEGYIDTTSNEYVFHIKDYQGNTRTNLAPTRKISSLDYYPFGVIYGNYYHVHEPYKYNGKEFDHSNLLNLYDYGARMYDPGMAMFTTIDPLAEKYYHICPYAYCANDPVNHIDPDGRKVVGVNEEARRNIINTLSIKEAKYVRFNKDGLLDTRRLNRSKSNSENIIALKALANSETFYKFVVNNKDIEGDSFSLLYKGLTAIPGEKNKPSPDNDIWIMTSSFLDERSQATNTAHEAYGHAYFFELNKTDKSYDYQHRYINAPGEKEWDSEFNMFVVPNIRTESNFKLKTQIELTTEQAERNYDSRKH